LIALLQTDRLTELQLSLFKRRTATGTAFFQVAKARAARTSEICHEIPVQGYNVKGKLWKVTSSSVCTEER